MADFSGMTVNERIFASGQLSQWDSAFVRRDRMELTEILNRVDLSDQAQTIIDSILSKNSG
jgi:hypothetical protein